MGKKTFYQPANLTEFADNQLSSIDNNPLFDAVVIKTNFKVEDIGTPSMINERDSFIQKTCALIDKSCAHLKDGGLIFIYGLPNYLAYFGEYLSDKKKDNSNYLFKYWIACEFQAEETNEHIPHAHIGLLMYLKSKSKQSPTPFEIDTKYTRVPYSNCLACANTTKDWGGKKHLINPLGSALSDVWSFFNTPIKEAESMPREIIDRILALMSEGKEVLLVNQKEDTLILSSGEKTRAISETDNNFVDTNLVVHQSCIDYLSELHKSQPDGVFDVAFADPPYNLAKNYSKYDDDLEEKKYIKWCNEWLLGMYNNLKPGGALLVLNIPKWSIYHFNFLADKMVFRNWIVWDALSTPAGKLSPAHYSLLYFTKRGGEPTINLNKDSQIDSRMYCLRGGCIKKRKEKKQNQKEFITDIWKDVHRIKHKKDRDQHPCQLPTKLMERIVNIFSNEGDLIFDPFGGAGTTAIAAKLLNRDYIITELDKNYVDIAERNLSKIQQDLLGELFYVRQSVVKTKTVSTVSRKHIESAYMTLCFDNDTIYSLEELKLVAPEVYELVEQYPASFGKLRGATRRKMDAQTLFA